MDTADNRPRSTAERRGGGGCARAIGVGCVVILGLVAVAGVALLLNLDTIRQSGWFRQAVAMKDEVTRTLELRQQLATEFPAQAIGVTIQDSSLLEDEGVRVLYFQFDNPEFLPDNPEDWDAMAKGIARRVTELHPTIETYERIEIAFSQGGGGFVSLENLEIFSFEVAEFLAPSEASEAPSPTDPRPDLPDSTSDN